MKSSQQRGGMRHVLRRLVGSEHGQGMVEYALIISVVALGTLGALHFLGGSITDLFNRAGASLAAGASGTTRWWRWRQSDRPPANPQALPGTITGLGGGNQSNDQGYFVAAAALPHRPTTTSASPTWTGIYTNNPPGRYQYGRPVSTP